MNRKRSILERGALYLAHNGPQRTFARAGEIFQMTTNLDEVHVWSVLDLTRESSISDRKLPDEISLVRGNSSNVGLLAQLDTIEISWAMERLHSGHELWIAREGDRAAFACWLFRHSIPILEIPGGTLHLEPDMVFLEDSIASMDYRGRGVAPGAYAGIFAIIRERGVKKVITKAKTENVAVRRALAKSGFKEIVTFRYRRSGFTKGISLRSDGGEMAYWLARQAGLEA